MGSGCTASRICYIISAALTLLGVALRTVCMLCCFDAAVGYFDEGALTVLMRLTYPLAIAAAVAGASLTPKGTLPTTLRTPARFPAAILVGLSLAVFSAVTAILCLPAVNQLLIAPILAALPAALYFFLSAGRDGRYPDWLSLLGFLPLLWCMLTIAETYTDLYTAMNSPIKISLHLGCMGFMLILLAELRFRLGKPLPRVAAALLSIGVFLCLTTAIPLIVAMAAGLRDTLPHLLYAVVLLCGGIYGALLLTSLIRPGTPTDNKQGGDGLCA